METRDVTKYKMDAAIRQRRYLGWLLVLMLLALTGLVGAYLWGQHVPLAQQVRVEGVPLLVLSNDNLHNKLLEIADREKDRFLTLILTDPNGQTVYSGRVRASDLGAHPDIETTWSRVTQLIQNRHPLVALLLDKLTHTPPKDVTLAWRVERGRFERFLQQLRLKVERPARDARLIILPDGNRRIIEEKSGIALPTDISERLANALQNKEDTVQIVLQSTPPRVTTDHLQGITREIGRAVTFFSERERNRSHNIRQAVAKINGLVLLPGDVFSYNEVVGPRTIQAGYRKAPVIIRGELVPGDGGGVCQVSTTLYMAGLQAGLQIVQRSKHVFPIAYAQAGLDATVVYGVLDLRLRNNTPSPVAITALAKGGKMQVYMFGGEEARKKVRLQRVVHALVPAPVKIYPSSRLPAGVKRVVSKGRRGVKVSVYRIIEEPGKPPVREKITTDFYRPQPRVVIVGQGQLTQDTSSENFTNFDSPVEEQ